MKNHKKHILKISLLRRLLRIGITLVSRLATLLRQDTVMIYRHTQLRGQTCPGEIRRVNWDNVDNALHMESPEMVDRFRAFLQRGDAGYYVYLKGKVIHRSWVQFGPGTAQCEMGVTFKLEAGDSYVQYCKTHLNVQGQGIYTAVLRQIAYDIHVQGLNLFIATIQTNPASIKGIEKAGFQLVQRVRSVLCFGLPIWKQTLD